MPLHWVVVVAEVLGRVHVERDVRYRMIILYPMRPLSLDYSGRLRLYGGVGEVISTTCGGCGRQL